MKRRTGSMVFSLVSSSVSSARAKSVRNQLAFLLATSFSVAMTGSSTLRRGTCFLAVQLDQFNLQVFQRINRLTRQRAGLVLLAGLSKKSAKNSFSVRTWEALNSTCGSSTMEACVLVLHKAALQRVMLQHVAVLHLDLATRAAVPGCREWRRSTNHSFCAQNVRSSF